jgi:hypothetical protein
MFMDKGDAKKKKKTPIQPMRLLGWKALNCFEEFYFLKLHWVVLYFTLMRLSKRVPAQH